MAWTEPKTWTAEPLVASDLNTHLRDNLNEIKDPPSAHYELNESADYTTTSSSFVNIDGTDGKLSLRITTNGGDVLVGFHGFIQPGNNATRVSLDVEVDTAGNRVGGDDGIIAAERAETGASPNKMPISFVRLITGLDADEHTFNLQWKVSGGTALLYAGAGTSGFDYHPQFWVREVS